MTTPVILGYILAGIVVAAIGFLLFYRKGPRMVARRTSPEGWQIRMADKLIGVVLLLICLALGYGLGKSSKIEPPIPVPPRVIYAPVGQWGESIPTYHGAKIRPDGPILIMAQNGQVYEDDKGKQNRMPTTPSVRLRSRTTKAVKVTVYK